MIGEERKEGDHGEHDTDFTNIDEGEMK